MVRSARGGDRPRSFSRGVFFVMSGSAGAQLIALGVLPILSRMYSPDSFGALSLVLAVSGLVVPIAMLRFEAAVLLPKSDKELRALVFVALLSAFTLSSLSVGVVYALGELGLFEASRVQFLPLWVGIFTLLTAAYALFSQLALREHSYKLVAQTSFLQAVGTAGAQVGLALISRESWALLLGAGAGRSVGLMSLGRAARKHLRVGNNYSSLPPWLDVRRVFANFWRFPLVFTPSHLLNAIGVHGPLIIITYFFGVAGAGQVGMAERIASAPLLLLGAAMGQVFSAEVARKYREGEAGIRSLFLRTSAQLAGVGLLVGVGFGALGGLLLPLILGESWALAGACIQAMALTVAVRLVVNPTGAILVVFQRATATLGLDATRLAIIVAAVLVISFEEIDIVGAVWLLYGGLALSYVATWFYCLWVVRSGSVRDSSMPDAR